LSLHHVQPPPAAEASIFSLMMCSDDNGLSMCEFNHLIVVCNLCKDWVGTESTIEKHYCPAHCFLELAVGGPVYELSSDEGTDL